MHEGEGEHMHVRRHAPPLDTPMNPMKRTGAQLAATLMRWLKTS